MAWKLNPERQIWLQLVDVLKFRIVSGQYPAGVKLPSVRELAAEAGTPYDSLRAACEGRRAGHVTKAAVRPVMERYEAAAGKKGRGA